MNEWPWKPTKRLRLVMKGEGFVLQQRWKQPNIEWKGTKTYYYEWRDVPVKEQGDE
jgi:hypothetical protein